MSELAKDPLLLDELNYFRNAASGRYRYLCRSASESFRGLFAIMAAAQYWVVVKSDGKYHRATVVSVTSGRSVGGAEVSGRRSEAGNRLKEKLNSASLIAKPKVIAVFLDAQGQEVGTALGYAAFAPLAGERTPILIIEREPPEFASIEYSAHARKF